MLQYRQISKLAVVASGPLFTNHKPFKDSEFREKSESPGHVLAL